MRCIGFVYFTNAVALKTFNNMCQRMRTLTNSLENLSHTGTVPTARPASWQLSNKSFIIMVNRNGLPHLFFVYSTEMGWHKAMIFHEIVFSVLFLIFVFQHSLKRKVENRSIVEGVRPWFCPTIKYN